MNVIHQQVHHSEFGEGKVIEQNETTVSVKFGKSYGVKKFLYPSAFGTFLKLHHIEVQEKINIEINQINEKTEAGRVHRESERENRRQEELLLKKQEKRLAAKKQIMLKTGDEKTTVKKTTAKKTTQQQGITAIVEDATQV